MSTFDLDRYLRLPRLSGLQLSPDGGRLAVAVSLPDPEGKRFVSALWAVDPSGARTPWQLTRSTSGEAIGTFARDGSLLFTSSRLDPDLTDERRSTLKDVSALWILPASGGEGRVLAAPHGGVDAVRTALRADVAVFAGGAHPGAGTPAEDEEREQARTKAGVSARLYEGFPIRFWDHYLGPRERHLFWLPLPGPDHAAADEPMTPMDLTPDAGGALLETDFDVSPDGQTIVTGWHAGTELSRPVVDLVAIDRATGGRRTLAHDDAWHTAFRISPDGRLAACIKVRNGTPDRADQPSLWLVDLGDGSGRQLGELGDLWPHELAWLPDSSALLGTADLHGSSVIFRADVDPGADGALDVIGAEGSFGALCPAADGRSVFALRSALDRPPHPVWVDLTDGAVGPLAFPGVDDAELSGMGTVERLVATAADGVPVESFLVLPAGASASAPAPLVVFIHGGPLGSWTGWHWRWNPQLLAARGYAVLMPDPAISTGYGQAFIDRGWGRWGEAPYTDILAAVDGALERPDLDPERTAAMGGSFGGYMANWVAGHTNRFRAIVTHASLWELRGFHGTSDVGPWWEPEFGDPYLDPTRYEEHSPHRHLDQIRTPMLVVHGELDLRVPISEALRLWTDLQRHGVPSRFLYFPDENHWVLKPQNARLWYETVLAFLDLHVLDRPWVRPALV